MCMSRVFVGPYQDVSQTSRASSPETTLALSRTSTRNRSNSLAVSWAPPVEPCATAVGVDVDHLVLPRPARWGCVAAGAAGEEPASRNGLVT